MTEAEGERERDLKKLALRMEDELVTVQGI